MTISETSKGDASATRLNEEHPEKNPRCDLDYYGLFGSDYTFYPRLVAYIDWFRVDRAAIALERQITVPVQGQIWTHTPASSWKSDAKIPTTRPSTKIS